LFANPSCFNETVTVFDKGKNYSGIMKIKDWIGKVNKEYKISMVPLKN
tara:strand:+ start:10096 stop:10239 length:144 start_codon:yes stop_codon:yes gene_type:complete